MDVVSKLIGDYTILISQPQIKFNNSLSLLGSKNVATCRHMTNLKLENTDIGLVAEVTTGTMMSNDRLPLEKSISAYSLSTLVPSAFQLPSE